MRLPLIVLVAAGVCLAGCGDDETSSVPSGAPYVTDASPAEGDSDVAVDTDTLRITFSEMMRTSAGSLSIDGGASLGTPSWDGQTLSVSLSGLAPESSYRVTLSGFEDLAGDALDGTRYLGDGALDFTTGPGGADVDAPTVIDADPNEGQLDVAIDLASISIQFSEAMDTAVTQATLTGGAAPVDLAGSWDAAGSTITFPVAGPLDYTTSYRLALSGYADVAGNPLDGATYLGDGALDFTTIANPDTTPPVVVSADPGEGAFNLDPDTQVIALTFSEDMDASITEVPFAQGNDAPTMVSGVWSDGDTVFTVTLGDYLVPGAVYHLDATGLSDEAGNAVDASDSYLADGVLDFAMGYWSGEHCGFPLTMAAASEQNGVYTWTVASSQVSVADGAFACDGNGSGSDAVIRYTKTSDTLANGGQLLHVSAVGLSEDINLEITSGSCSAGVVASCLWVKASWDKFLDVPAGTYWIWVADNNTGTFPGATVTVEEIPATAPQAEGEGCFAPYTTASSIHTPPATANDPHVWTIPATINGFEIAPSSSSVGSISCDNHATYGDIHGPDAVIAFNKTEQSSVLLVEVENLDPSLAQSDINVEVLDGCDTVAPNTSSLYCAANADLHAFTVTADMGLVYLWVATEATTEEFNGVEVRVREFVPALGETISSAEPLTMSGPINPTSSVGLDRPSCFPTSGNIHWYSYTTTDTLFGVQGDAAAPIAIVQGNGTELSCSTDTSSVAIGKSVPAGTTLYIAVESPTAIGNLAIVDQTYGGPVGNVTNLNISFPTSAATEYSMAVGANEIFMGSTTEIWSFSKAGNDTAVEHNTGEGIASTHLGYSITVANGKLFSVDTTTSTTASRLFAVHDEAAMSWGPTAWDTPVSYPTSIAAYAMNTDGANLIMAARETLSSEPLVFLSVPASAPATATVLGQYTGVYYVTGLAADASYFYVAGIEATNQEFLYRFDRSNLAAPPLRLARINTNTTKTNVEVDNLTAANYVYVRDDDSDLHVIALGTTPIDLGVLATIGGTADYAMGIDHASGRLYMFDATLGGSGGVVEIQ